MGDRSKKKGSNRSANANKTKKKKGNCKEIDEKRTYFGDNQFNETIENTRFWKQRKVGLVSARTRR